MAELDVGKHCSVTSCKLKDFLPISCASCSEIFCKDHISLDAHNCSQVNVTTDHGKYTGPKSYPCSVDTCSNKELTEIICSACQKNFCLSHRHQVDHACANYEVTPEKMTKTKAHIENIIESKKFQGAKVKGRGRKSKVTAAKVGLMKIKMAASGDRGIPDTERVYLQVILPKSVMPRAKPMFFSKVWSVGRLIDAAATITGIQNNNNVATAKKLRLFDADDGHVFSTDGTVETHLTAEDGLLNGGTVILEYVDSDTTRLDQPETYKL